MSESSAYTTALEAITAGICAVPPAEDGSKRPLGAGERWKQWQTQRPDEEQVRIWYEEDGRTGFGFLCGRISGNLELFECERLDVYDAFVARAREVGLGDVIDRIEDGWSDFTPGGGIHLHYQCDEIAGNTQLARCPKRPDEMRHPDDTVQVLIETRGEGGYGIGAPSSGTVHPTGRPYRRHRGGPATIATLTPEERRDLHALARTFDQMPRAESKIPEARTSTGGGDQPGDAFNARAEWGKDVLEPHGWRYLFAHGSEDFWCRPGKDRGVGATTNYADSGLLYVFSTSTPFVAERGYDKFGAYAVLNRGGDLAAAARALYAKGYGAASEDTGGTDRTDKTHFGGFGSEPSPSDEVTWPDRQRLPPRLPSTPTMPSDMVPMPLQDWTGDIATRSCLPLEMVAVAAIVSAGSVIGRRIGIRPGRFDNFVTVPNAWGALVARPGWMKTNVVKEGFKPVGILASEAHERYEAEKEAAEVEIAALNAQLKAIESRMNDAAKKGGNLAELKEEFRAKRAELKAAIPIERRYLTHDATTEKLGELLRDNPRGMLLLRDELSGWLRTLDKPGREGDREFFLEAWNGTGSFTTDRIGRGTVHIPSLCLSVFGSIQPGKLQALVANAVEGGTGDDGLLQRFQLMVYPDRLDPWQKPDRWPDAAASDAALGIYRSLDALSPSLLGASGEDIPYLTFTPGGQVIYDRWRDRLEHRLRSDELDGTPAFASHLAKYRSLLPELALVFHLIDVVAGRVRGPVGEAATHRAVAWCAFLEQHARKVYAVELDGGASAAITLAAKIEAGAVLDGQPVRELYRAQWSGLRSPERVLLALSLLTDLGWLRMETVGDRGRPSQIVRLHPDLRARTRSGGQQGD